MRPRGDGESRPAALLLVCTVLLGAVTADHQTKRGKVFLLIAVGARSCMGPDVRGAMLALLLCLAASRFAIAGEADYTLDDSFWNEESPVGEVERLLREFRQNQELVRNIGAHYYQIIYPVQLRHHEKMGISTREVSQPQKFPGRGYGGDFQAGIRGRGRTGKHFHRTSLLIKAFNHKFRLDLELNTQLLAPNVVQKHFLANGAEQISKQEIEHCYYHGTVKDYPGATAAFHTCNGVSGVIHIGNETFVIHPFYGGDLSKHPHVIFEARTKPNKGCANSGNLEWRIKNLRRTKHITNYYHEHTMPNLHRYRRDVRETTKYIETALVIDHAMFERRNGSTRAEVVNDAIQVANIADLYFRTLNTRVSLVYIETWQGNNQAQIEKGQDISRALLNFNDYTQRMLFKIEKDTTQLLTGVTFQGGEAGVAVPETVCTPKSVGISVDSNSYEPHLLAGTMAHMIGHNIGMGHDDGREQCYCRDWHGCIMSQSIMGAESVQPYKFSECSKSDYIDALRIGHGICLLNKPNQLVPHRTCGNGQLEEGEECDCGTIEECHERDPCCDPITCRLTKEAQCATGECCENCQLRHKGVICRDSSNECDLPESCTGEHGACPADAFRKSGAPCASGTGYCFQGVCPTLSLQCEQIWGYGGQAADRQCFEQFNSKGAVTGHCGKDAAGHYLKCEQENVRCGSLQCQLGNRYPVISGMDEFYSRTVITIKGTEFECKSTTGSIEQHGIPEWGLVREGTPCGDNLVCVNQTCTSIFPFVDQARCPTNHNNMECSGHGVCSNMNKCHCQLGWAGPDCSLREEITTSLPPPPREPTTPAHGSTTKSSIEMRMEKKETAYETDEASSLSTMVLVFILLSGVLSIFVGFAVCALYCFRRKSTLPKYDPPYVKKPIAKSFPGASSASNHSQEDISMDGGKIMSFNQSSSSFSSRGDSQRVLFRHGNHMGSGGNPSRFQDIKMQPMKRIAVCSGSEEDPIHSGEEDCGGVASFIDVAPGQGVMGKLPEKGILKKQHGYGSVVGEGKDKWGDDQSDQCEVMSQAGSSGGGEGPAGVADMEIKFKDLNGYHEGIIVALKTAAAHRMSAGSAGTAMADEQLRKSLQDCTPHYRSQDKLCDVQQTHTVMLEGSHHRSRSVPDDRDEDDADPAPSCGPIRIRNLEDLIRQLEHHSSRHMSPSGSEDIRMSETEADRHYRIDANDMQTPTNRCRGRTSSGASAGASAGTIEEETRFVYGRYRQPSLRPHPPHRQHDDDTLYETADAHRRHDDSESDEFIQAQQQLARWASEDTVAAGAVGAAGRGYFPSPPDDSSLTSSTSDAATALLVTPLSSAATPLSASDDAARPASSASGAGAAGSTGGSRYPEYAH